MRVSIYEYKGQCQTAPTTRDSVGQRSRKGQLSACLPKGTPDARKRVIVISFLLFSRDADIPGEPLLGDIAYGARPNWFQIWACNAMQSSKPSAFLNAVLLVIV